MTKLPDTPEVAFAKNIASAIRSKYDSKSYIVGGYYRDAQLGLSPKDLDMVVCVLPDDTERIMIPNAHTIATGKEHGTITFVQESTGVTVEVTTTQTRVEKSDDRKGSEVIFLSGSDSFEEDARRRDLTINSIMYDPLEEVVFDPMHGLDDIQNRILRFNDDALGACRGDALRVMRLARFYTKLGNMGFSLDPRIFDVAKDEVVQRRLMKLSAERVRDEFLKTLSLPDSEYVARAVTLLHELGVIDLWFPELSAMVDVEQNVYHSEDVWGHALLAVSKSKPGLVHRLFALFHDVGKPLCAEFKTPEYGYSFHGHESVSADMFLDMCRRMKFGNRKSGNFDLDIQQVAHLIRHHMDAFVLGKPSRMLKRLGVDKWGEEMVNLSWDVGRSDFFAKSPQKIKEERNQMGNDRLIQVKQKVHEILAKAKTKKVKDLSLNGNDVMRLLNVKPCARVGRLLQALFEAVVDDGVPDTPEDLTLALVDLYKHY